MAAEGDREGPATAFCPNPALTLADRGVEGFTAAPAAVPADGEVDEGEGAGGEVCDPFARGGAAGCMGAVDIVVRTPHDRTLAVHT